MLRTPSEDTPQVEGIDQQDFKALQLVSGAYPFQIGLQKRIPGKTLISQQDGPVGGIMVFYNALGRHYNLIDYGGGNIQIDEVLVPPITLPGLPPTSALWYDTFSSYVEDLVSLIWGAGVWPDGYGLCQTIIQGIFDPFLVYAVMPNFPNADTSDKPTPLPTPEEDPETTPVSPGSPEYLYPPGTVDLVLRRTVALADNSCTGQGTQPVSANDILRYRDYSGGPEVDSIIATAITVGDIVLFHGARIGRSENEDLGLVQGTCPGPPQPTPTEYSLYATTGEISQDS